MFGTQTNKPERHKSLPTRDSDVTICSARGRVLCNEDRCDTTTCQASDDVILMTLSERKGHLRVTSGFRHEVHENCTLLSCYAASSGNFLSTFRDNFQGSRILLEVFSKGR